MMAALLSLDATQRFLRIRRLLREVRGQRALVADLGIEERIRSAAELRIVEASADLVDELDELDQGGVLNAVAECFVIIFGGVRPADPEETKAP